MRDSWTEAVAHFAASLPPHTFNTWLRPLNYRGSEKNQIVIEVPNVFYRDRLKSEFVAQLREKLREIAKNPALDLTLVVADLPAPTPATEPPSRPATVAPEPKLSDLPDANRRYTFDSFVIGTSNQFAHAASFASAESPGQVYNPLFIYGGVGLGKTHLLSAIGNRIIEQRPGLRVVYRSAEQFMNEMINSIRFEKTAAFRSKYRDNCDVLLLDDIQFLRGKERTQEEFFHTFNALHQANKQIAMTSDQVPKDIPDLDERLRSRFQWGLFCDIQPPDIETRAAILKNKAAASSVSLPDDVTMYLASQIKSNVRVLEGSLVRLSAHASLAGKPITVDLAKEVLGSMAGSGPGLTAELIQRQVAQFFNLNVADLKSSRRHKVVALPRQIAMYLTRKLTEASYPEIGDRFGGKDHTTVMHGVAKIERLLQQDARLRSTLAALEQGLGA